jgi:hypothetical protein
MLALNLGLSIHANVVVDRDLRYARRTVSSWQPMNSATSNALIRRLGSPLLAGPSAGGCVVAVCADSVYVVFLIGPSAHVRRRPTCDRRLVLGIDEPSRDGATGGRSAWRRSARVADSVRRDSCARATRSLESHAGGRRRCVADMRDAPHSPDARALRPVLGEVARDGLSMGSRALGGAPGYDGQYAGSSQIAVALGAVTDCLRPSDSSAATCQPFRCWVLLATDL